MTPRQRELARHALGFQKPSVKQSYRNRFHAGPDHDDYADWMEMIGLGFAGRVKSGLSPDFVFYLTARGARLALNPGERLCPEDFPKERNDDVHATLA